MGEYVMAPAGAALFAFAASAFAEAPCVGPFYKPEMPEKLRPTK